MTIFWTRVSHGIYHEDLFRISFLLYVKIFDLSIRYYLRNIYLLFKGNAYDSIQIDAHVRHNIIDIS